MESLLSYPSFTVVFLSGGCGSRFGGALPKQYVDLCGKPLALHSFEVFLSIPEVEKYVVVCAKEWESIFIEAASLYGKKEKLYFAPPGTKRQESVWNGIALLAEETLVCIHDAARPFIDKDIVRKTVLEATSFGAAAVGVMAKSTMKMCDENGVVQATLDRSSLFEIQTPQVVDLSLLKEGFATILAKGLTVTDDLSVVECIQRRAKIVPGSYRNIKVTTQEDFKMVEYWLCSVTS